MTERRNNTKTPSKRYNKKPNTRERQNIEV